MAGNVRPDTDCPDPPADGAELTLPGRNKMFLRLLLQKELMLRPAAFWEYDMRPHGYLLVCVLGLVLLPGCGRSMAPVKGRVTCNGQPVADAALIFSPMPRSEDDQEPGKAAAAATDADGRFVLGTFQEGDGAFVGRHRVAITLDPKARGGCRSRVVIVEVKPDQNELNIELNE